MKISKTHHRTKKGVVKRNPVRKIPFVQAMAEQEAACNGKYTGTHWRDEFKNWKEAKRKKRLSDKELDRRVNKMKRDWERRYGRGTVTPMLEDQFYIDAGKKR
jgi:hypothetical protein